MPLVRRAALEKLWLCWTPWRQASNLLRRAGETGPSPIELVANGCFGRVADHQRLALEGLIAREQCSAQSAEPVPPDQDPAGSVG